MNIIGKINIHRKLNNTFMLIMLLVIFIIAVLKINTKQIMILPLDNVVKVRVVDNYGDSWQGTGVFIRDNLILTAGHVVDNVSEVTINWSDGREQSAESWYKESEADVGFIYINTVKDEPIVDFADIKVGDSVWAYGNPFGVFPVLTKGIISAVDMYDDYWNQKNMIISDIAINPGNSGCPLFNRDGKIVGICSWGYIYSQGMNYFIRAEVCRLSLNKYNAIRALEEIK